MCEVSLQLKLCLRKWSKIFFAASRVWETAIPVESVQHLAAMEKDLQLPVATTAALSDLGNNPKMKITKMAAMGSNLGVDQWQDGIRQGSLPLVINLR